jgi:hypothetical protein
MSYYARNLKYFDSGLLSGSGDPMRTALAAGYTKETNQETGQTKYVNEFKPLASSTTSGEIDHYNETINDYIDFRTEFPIYGGVVGDVKYSSDNAVPILKYPIRVFGDNQTVYSDLHWKNYFIGGQYRDQEYDGIYSTEEFTDHMFAYTLPYLPKVVKQNNPDKLNVFSTIDITYDYNYYYKNYENSNSEKSSVLEIPNGYVMQTFSHSDELRNIIGPTTQTPIEKFTNSLYGNQLVNFVTRNGKFNYNVYNDLFITNEDFQATALAEGEARWQSETVKTKKYFQYYYPYYNIDDSTNSFVSTKFKNIFFDHKTLANEYQELFNNRKALPFYTRISMPVAGTGEITDNIESSDVSGKFLLTLKEIFVDNSLDSKTTATTFSIQETEHLKDNIETTKIYDGTVRLLPMFDFLNEMRINYTSISEDFYCVGNPYDTSRRALYDKLGDYRHLNTIGATKAIVKMIDIIERDAFLEKIRAPFGKSSTVEKNKETIAFRIEKIGGEPIGDSNTQQAIQNFFIFNGSDLQSDFIDTQVKYGELYTYNVYAYVLVNGYRYQTSDLRVTRKIADISRPEDTEDVSCLEFYDPYTGNAKDRLVQSNTFIERELDNEFATQAQIASAKYKFLADFNVTVQPSPMLIEIPVATNSVRVMDHPVNRPSVVPFQIKDSSQRIGFDVFYTAFEKHKYPPAISLMEQQLKRDYLDSNSIFENELLQKESVSNARYVEVFRVDKKPNSFEDFENHKIHTSDLLVDEDYIPVDEDGVPLPSSEKWWTIKDGAVYNNCIIHDTLETNVTYYYAFRFLNERREPGFFSPIYQVELVNDGGYYYPRYDTIFEKDLNPNKNINTTKKFKKLLNVVPNLQHVMFDDSNVDYNKSAFSQIQFLKIGLDNPMESEKNTNSLWGKTFKFRFTSKKTGKKIDLNITYKLTR